MEEKLDLILNKIESMDSKLGNIEAEVKELKDGQSGLRSELEEFKKETEKRFDKVDGEIIALNACFDIVADRFDEVDKKFDLLDKKLDLYREVSRSQAAKQRELELRIEVLEDNTVSVAD